MLKSTRTFPFRTRSNYFHQSDVREEQGEIGIVRTTTFPKNFSRTELLTLDEIRSTNAIIRSIQSQLNTFEHFDPAPRDLFERIWKLKQINLKQVEKNNLLFF